MIPVLTRLSPMDGVLGDMDKLHREMSRWLEGYRGPEAEFPAINIWSNPEKAMVTAELPGVDAHALNISVTDATLTIEGERKADELGKDEIYHLQERGYGRFSRIIRLPYDVDAEKVSAHYTRGVLEITLPRHEATKPRKINVSGV